MERFSNNRFNPRRYEDNLSVFGRKVLNVLVQKWRHDQNHSQNSQHGNQDFNNTTHNRRVLTFRDKETPSRPLGTPTLPIIGQKINTENDIQQNQSFDFNADQNARLFNNVPTTSQLVQTFDTSDKAAATVATNIARDGFVDCVIEGRVPNDMFKEKVHVNELTYTHKSSVRVDEADHANEIDWDNMFDTELFSTEAALASAQFVLEQIEKPVPNTFHIQFPSEIKKTCENITKKQSEKLTEKNNNEAKKFKRKNQLITDAIPKKLKKLPEESKISFRKQKFTKAVKNWLNDVDPKYYVERNDLEQNETTTQVKITVEKANEKSNKKVVQAQLANKGGIMKFRKPKAETKKIPGDDHFDESIPSDKSEIKEKNLETPEKNKVDGVNQDKTPKDYKTEKNMNKVTKNKSKFVVPIKSQIPIKDVEFRVTVLDENNIYNHLETLRCIENQELVIVLIYRNGFCQLNNHFTEDTCDAEGFIMSIDDNFFLCKGDYKKHNEILQSLLEKNKVVCYEGKELLSYFKSDLDLDIYKINMIDAKIGGSILDPDSPPENFSELQKLLSFTPQFTIATDCVLQKTAWYASLLKECCSKLVNLLMEEQLWNVFTNIEMKLLPIIAEMESRGVSVDLQKIKWMEDILLTKMKLTELECHKAAGKTFQINSPMQVRALIYDELKLDAKCNMKIRETLALGAKSTSEAMLRGLVSVHPLPRLILEYRHLHKAHATFLTGIAQHVKDGIVRPTWVQTAAATGRIASNNPNLQAIPKSPFSLVLFPVLNETKDVEHLALSFRSVYTSRAGCRLLACDFKHVECRVFAHAAADGRLLALLRARQDIFRALAHKWLEKPAAAVTREDRERTKRIVYASLYGAGVRKLMDILAVGYEQALAVQTSFNRTFPSLKSFGQSVVSRCAARGGRLATLGGRVRRFDNIASRDGALKAQAERQAVNFIIQGSAADLCKLAMVEACLRLRSHAPPLDARLLLQIHDELVWEVRGEHLHAAAVIKRAMEECGLQSGMQDPLPVALSVGTNWGQMSEYRPDMQ